MCDFRIIKRIELLNGVAIDIDTIERIDFSDFINNNISKEGLYSIIATGGFYSYFDGDKWLKEDTDYIVIESENELNHNHD